MDELYSHFVAFVEGIVEKELIKNESITYEEIIAMLNLCDNLITIEEYIRENNISLNILFGSKYFNDFIGFSSENTTLTLLSELIDVMNENASDYFKQICCYGIKTYCNGNRYRVERLSKSKMHQCYLTEHDILFTYFFTLYESKYKEIIAEYFIRRDNPLK
jgi:hypothetical protein